MGTARKKKDNIHIRVEPEQKEVINRAADLLGLDLSAFVLLNTLKAARAELAQVEKISLSTNDANLFFEALTNPSAPNDNLKAAYQKYQEELGIKDQSFTLALEFCILDKSIDRSNFDCGISELNTFLKRQARQQQSKGFNRTFVLINDEDSPLKVLGFYSLSMGEINLDSLPEEKKKKLPKHPVPVARIGRLAVDNSAKGKGCGEMMLVDALRRVQRASMQIGVYAIVGDAKDDSAKSFYEKFNFIPFQDESMSLFIPLALLPS